MRRLLIAMAAGLVMVGAIGARLGQAQGQPEAKPSPAVPADDSPPPLPKDAPADAPPPVGKEDPFGGEAKPIPAEPAPKPKPKPKAKAKASRPADVLPKAPVDPEPVNRDDPPAPETVPPDPVRPDAPKTDDEVIPAQAPAGDAGGMPPAKERATGSAASATAPAGDPFLLSPDRLPYSASTGSLTVEVQAPANANLNRPVKFKILVKNSGTTTVMGVIVRDPLPEALEFVKSEPECAQVGNILTWHLESLTGGQERALVVTAIPRKTGDLDHAPTVSLRMGSKSRTMVKQPKLKVEIAQGETGKVLKGRPVTFNVRVTNNGTGPAKGVVLHADLSSGLKHDEGSSLIVNFKEYSGKDALGPGESEAIDLEVDASAGGLQECKVYAESPDVEDSPDARGVAKVDVVEPKLVLDLKGPLIKYTDSVGGYVLTVTNPGSATARNVVAAAFLPTLGGGKLMPDYTPSEARWSAKERKLWWGVGDLEPGATKELKFNVQLGGVGLYKVEAGAQADRCPRESKTCTTEVQGMPDITCEVIARTKVLDVGEETIYTVRLSNRGTKEAANVLVTADLSENLRIVDTSGTDKDNVAKSSSEGAHDAKFPALNIAPRGAHELTLRVKAMKAGQATCKVKVVHEASVLEYSSTTKVMEPR